jgi:flagellar motor switch protein FliG
MAVGGKEKEQTRDLTAIQKAAIIIASLGIDGASNIFKGLSESEMEELTFAITTTQSIPEDQKMKVQNEFCDKLRAGFVGSEMFSLQALLERSVGREKAESILHKIQTSREDKFFELLNQLDPKQISTAMQNERPQTLALILCHLNPRRAAEILSLFDPAFQSQVVVCIGRMDRIAPEVVSKVDSVVRRKLSGMQGRLRITGGPKIIAQVMNFVDRSTEKRIFEALRSKDPALVDDIKKLMLLFEDLVSLSDVAVQAVLREIDINDLALALKGAAKELKELIYRNLSKRAAERLQEEMELLGPKPRADVDSAQQRIVAVVRRLEEEGKLQLGGHGSEEELVT